MGKMHIHSVYDIDDVIESLSRLDRNSLMEFMVGLDEQIADYDFTKELVGKLQDALDAEEEVVNG